VERVGNGVALQACSMSSSVLVAGKLFYFSIISSYRILLAHVAGLVTAPTVAGTTSLQSTRSARLCPRIASFPIAARNLVAIKFWLLMNDCQVQAVRASRAKAPSDWRRSSPTMSPVPCGSGERSSPTLPDVPGKPVPLRRVSRKN
jgi:hypothetical protein